MNEDLKKELKKIADTIRGLSIDAVQKANSGHPGLPLGCADIAAYLFGHHMRFFSKEPNWPNRDYFVLSAGHGSMLLYSCLHLAGYDLSLEDLMQFRQLHAKTPGHPEYGMSDGVEVTTGPLGQGVGNAIGLALGNQILKQRFNTEEFPLFDSKVFCLAGDGDFMEGVSAESCSLAGHLELNNLVILYDNNQICLDGPTSECFVEDTKMRMKAYGFEVYEIDGYDYDEMDQVLSSLRQKQSSPAFVVLHTIIGKGSPNKAGTHSAHGSPLGEEEVALTKKELGISLEAFHIPGSVATFFTQRQQEQQEEFEKWQDQFRQWSKAHEDLFQTFSNMQNKVLPEDLLEKLQKISGKQAQAGRSSSAMVLQELAKDLPFLIGGSADLSGSDKTMLKEYSIMKPRDFQGRNIKYGVREFGMATCANGLFRTGMFVPFIGTFLTFSDYMRNAIRLAALSHYQVIYQFTHDSIFLGEDGPTHQPIEHLAALRAMPNLYVFRPADFQEVKMSWIAALKHKGPSALILSRQNLPELEQTKVPFEQGVAKGAYVIQSTEALPDYVLLSTGSELSLSIEVAKRLEKLGKKVRVVSFICWELFDQQPLEYKQSVLPENPIKISIEAASDFGWAKYIGSKGITIGIDGFGLSAPITDLQTEFGFTVDSIVERIMASANAH